MVSMYDAERNEKLADHLEAYVDTIDRLFILEGTKEKEVKKAKNVILEACKNLRNNKPNKVFSKKRYAKYMIDVEEGRILGDDYLDE